LDKQETYLLKLLRAALTPGEPAFLQENPRSLDWEKLLHILKRHGVSALVYDELVTEQRLPAQYREAYERECRRTVLRSYRLLFLGRAIIQRLEQNRIPALVLKGSGIAGMYPVPELRKSGDVDILLLRPGQLKEACAVLEAAGFVREHRQHSLHHVGLLSPERIAVEVHTLLAEPFDDRRTNRYMQEKIQEGSVQVIREEVMGVSVPRLADGEQAYALLLHMLHHFLGSGFGLKLLCDWVVFWNHDHGQETKERYRRMIRDCGLEGFSDMVTAVCVRYLGLAPEKAVIFSGNVAGPDAELFFEEILEAGEFGMEQKERMVALRGIGPMAYLREFHHQMHRNYPRAGRFFLCWPVLWVLTLLTFLHNNRTVRHVSAIALLKKAGQRSRLTKKMRLYYNRN
jgi:hypothetical protein